MVYLKIDDYIIEFYATTSPLNFGYDINNSGLTNKCGTLNLHEVILNKEVIEKIINKKPSKLYLIKDNFELDLTKNVRSIFIGKERIGQNILSFSIEYYDVFEYYDYFTKNISKIFNPPTMSYDCFATSNVCNLNCPYCTQGKEHNKVEFKMRLNYEIFHNYIKSVIDTNFKNFPIKRKTARLMGGETFLDMNSFKNAYNSLRKIVPKIDDLWIYTNYTINTDLFLEYWEEMKKNVEHLMLVITSDSLDYNKSLRLRNESIMNQYINNIKNTREKTLNDKKITMATNIMYLSKEETLKTALTLYDMGVNFIQLAYDEFTNIEESEEIKKNLNSIFEELKVKGIPRLKPNLGQNLWLHFMVNDGEVEIYRSKLCLGTDYVVSVMNDY